MGKVIESNPLTGIKKTWHEEPDGSVVIAAEQDVTALLEANAYERKESDGRFKGEKFHLMRSIPPHIYFALPPEIREDAKAFKKWLNDHDQIPFRVHPGRI